jgi:hypothetical protein
VLAGGEKFWWGGVRKSTHVNAYREKVRPGTGREAGLGHVGKGREQERKLGNAVIRKGLVKQQNAGVF